MNDAPDAEAADPVWSRVYNIRGNWIDPSSAEFQRAQRDWATRRGATKLEVWDGGEDDYQIPPRGWLLGTSFCRRFLSSLLAPGGVGKTALRIAQLLSLATGRSLTNEHVFARCRVLLLSLEDDRDELRRRVCAALRHHGIPPEEVKGWLYLAAPKGLRLAEMVDGAPATAELLLLLQQTIAELKIDVVSLDPFVKAHGLDENDNVSIDFVCTLVTKLAIDADCAIDLPHHARKGIASPGDSDRARGASSMRDAGRLVYTLTQMTSEEAGQFGISESERRALIRMDSAKVNIAPPSTDAHWFRLVGVALDNGTGRYPMGDSVQTVEPWQPPKLWDSLDIPLLDRILDDLERGMDNGQRYSAAGPAGIRAAWRVVQRHAVEKTEEQCRRVIATWMKSGTLFAEPYDDPVDRKPRTGLRVNPTKRPS